MGILKKYIKYSFPELLPLWVAVFIDILGFSILIPFLPFFSQKFHAPAWQIGLLLSTNALFSFFSGPIWGSLSDTHGRKPMLLISQLGTLVGFLMLAFSNNMAMMFVSRIVDGIFGGNYPIAKAIIGDVVPPEHRSEQMSNIGVAHVLSSLVGPGVGALLSQWGIKAPGLMAAALTAGTIALTFFLLKESNPLLTGAAPTTASISAPQIGTGRQPPPKNSLAMRRRNIWENTDARYLLIQWAFHTLSFMTYVSCISLFANLKLGLNAKEVGQLLMLSGFVRVFVRFFVFVPLRRKLGDRTTSLIGLSTFVVIYFLLGFVQTPLQFGLVLCVVSFAASCSRGILNSFLSRSVKPWEQGTTMGLSASLDSFAQIVGPLIGGLVLDSLPLWIYGGLASAFALGAFLMSFKHFDVYYGTAVALVD